MKRITVVLLLLAPLALAGCTLNNILGTLANQAPEAVIDASPQQGHAPLTVTFDAHYSHDDGAIAEFHWNFGDPHDTEPSSSIKASHTYRLPGTYLVKMTVIDEMGKLDSEKMAIVVQNPPPVASFEVSNNMPPVGDTVSFDATASYDPNGDILSYFWDFGDGNTGIGIVTNHAYAQDIYYVVTLTVTDNDGETGIERQAVIPQTTTIDDGGCPGGSCGGGSGDKPLAVITGVPSCSGWEVHVPITLDGSFSRAAEGGRIIQYKWDFGDGETATGAIVIHTYTKTGRYAITLTVNDDSGQQSSNSGVIDIRTKNY